MPRAPKSCKRSQEPKELPKEAKVAKGAKAKAPDRLAESCKSWVKGQIATLPTELIQKLSHEIFELKMSSWKGELRELTSVAHLDQVLPEVFRALEKKVVTAGDLKVKSKASEKLQNNASGLLLAAMVLDLSAFQRHEGAPEVQQVQPSEEVLASAMAFLWQQARFTLPTMLDGHESASTCSSLARCLRSMHHVLAARRYNSKALPACLAHRAAPMAGQCLSLALKAPGLAEAASDLLAALAGYGCAESALQEAAMAELDRLATLGSMFVNGLKAGPSFLALALPAVSAPLLPVGLYSKAPEQLTQMACERVGFAEARAGHVAALVIQHGLLERNDAEGLLRPLLGACGSVSHAAAPLVLWRLLHGLNRVAGAPRSADLDCTQREEAVKLLGLAAAELTKQMLEAQQGQKCTKCGHLASSPCEICALKGSNGSKISTPLALLVDFLDSLQDERLAPARGELQGSCLSASSSYCNAAALLCLSLATPACGKKKTGKSIMPLKAPECLRLSWASHDRVVTASRKASSKEWRSAERVHRRMQWEPEGLLARARVYALESLLSLARSNPLAHVRRQALVGLGACCTTEPGLIASKCVAEAVAAGLQDEAAWARLASLDLVLQLGRPEGALQPRVLELRQACRARLGDASVAVRRGAVRACAAWLREAPSLAAAAELLRGLRGKGEGREGREGREGLRQLGMPALREVIFEGEVEEVVERLCSLHETVGPSGIRDLLAHAKADTSEMEAITSCALKALPSTEKMEVHLSILEQLSLETPTTFHKHLSCFVEWLRCETSGSLVLPVAACNILAQVLPSWTACASSLAKQKMADQLVEELATLLDESTAPSNDLGQLARVVVQCFVVVVEHLCSRSGDLLLGHFGRSVRSLSEPSTLSDGQLCRFGWLLGSLLEFLDAKSMAQLGRAHGVQAVTTAAVQLLADCCVQAPAAVQPAMLAALGFALRRYPELLDLDASSPLEVFKQGLRAKSILCLKTAETLATLATSYQEFMEDPKKNCYSAAAQKLGSLQAELAALLAVPEAVPLALKGFRSLCDLGVLHSASALPGIISVTMVGRAAPEGRFLLQRLVESGPPLLAQRLSLALRSAARQIQGAVYGDHWRFAPLCEVYGEYLDSKQMRDQFLCCLVSEACSEDACAVRIELVVGLLARLPIRKELELARIFHSVVQFLTLKVAPYLMLEDYERRNPSFPAPSFATCAAAAVLHQLCVHWLQMIGPDLAKQMRSTWDSPFSLSDDQALPMSFSRRLPDLSAVLEKIRSVKEPEDLLQEIACDSPLLNSKAAARVQLTRKRLVEDGKGSRKCRRGPKVAKEAAAVAAAEASAMSKAAAGA